MRSGCILGVGAPVLVGSETNADVGSGLVQGPEPLDLHCPEPSARRKDRLASQGSEPCRIERHHENRLLS